ncbi:hypothetical protein pb186bvf_002774 [Paramecium bursaria]
MGCSATKERALYKKQSLQQTQSFTTRNTQNEEIQSGNKSDQLQKGLLCTPTNSNQKIMQFQEFPYIINQPYVFLNHNGLSSCSNGPQIKDSQDNLNLNSQEKQDSRKIQNGILKPPIQSIFQVKITDSKKKVQFAKDYIVNNFIKIQRKDRKFIFSFQN